MENFWTTISPRRPCKARLANHELGLLLAQLILVPCSDLEDGEGQCGVQVDLLVEVGLLEHLCKIYPHT